MNPSWSDFPDTLIKHSSLVVNNLTGVTRMQRLRGRQSLLAILIVRTLQPRNTTAARRWCPPQRSAGTVVRDFSLKPFPSVQGRKFLAPKKSHYLAIHPETRCASTKSCIVARFGRILDHGSTRLLRVPIIQQGEI